MKPYYEEKGTKLFQGDCLEVMRHIPDASIDACITDPPYGTTACSWDAVIPFAPMWAELKRIVKKNGAIVLFGSQPFTSALVMSNPRMFRYQWVWEKPVGTGFLDANVKPLKCHEDVVVFYLETPTYNPQKWRGQRNHNSTTPVRHTRSVYGGTYERQPPNISELKFPRSVIKFDKHSSSEQLHVNQKPVELLRYLIRTYTNEGDTVLDFTCGSGTTGVACVIERREFIGIEQDAHYCEVSAARIKRAQGIACDVPKRVKQYAPTPLFEEAVA